MSWVIKHNEQHIFLEVVRGLPQWTQFVNDAETYATKEEADAFIKARRIPYCKAKELSKRDR